MSKTYRRKEVMEMLNVTKLQMCHATNRTGFRKRHGSRGEGYHFNYTERDIKDLKRYFDALKEWDAAIKNLGKE